MIVKETVGGRFYKCLQCGKKYLEQTEQSASRVEFPAPSRVLRPITIPTIKTASSGQYRLKSVNIATV
jgi:transposase-like protein